MRLPDVIYLQWHGLDKSQLTEGGKADEMVQGMPMLHS